MMMLKNNMQFRYYYGMEADQFNFIRIPKCVITDPLFSDLSITSKVLYGLLLDRMNLSMKNGWVDEENRVFIIYQVADLGTDLGISRKRAIDTLQELEEFGLVEKKRRGLGMPSLLYIKSFMVEKDCSHTTEEIEEAILAGTSRSVENVTSENDENDTSRSNNIDTSGSTGREHHRSNQIDTSRSNVIDTSKSNENDTSRGNSFDTSGSTNFERPKVTESTPQSNTNINNTKVNYTKSNPISSDEEMYSRPLMLIDERDEIDETTLYRMLIEETIDYNVLMERYPADREAIEGIVDLLHETMLSKNDTMVVASNEYSTNFVKGKLMKLNMFHIEYVLDCLSKNKTKVNNIKQYVLAALFNAPSTMNSYFTATVNHDLYGEAK